MSMRPCEEGSWLWESGRPGIVKLEYIKPWGQTESAGESVEQVMSNGRRGAFQTFRDQGRSDT